jgi:hypothetical protein
MASGTLYRPVSRDRNGDPVDADGNVVHVGTDATEIGEVHGLVLGGPSWRPADGGIVDTTGLVGVPVDELTPRHGDLLVIDSVRYRIAGPPQWVSRGLVSTPPRYYWWTVTAVCN